MSEEQARSAAVAMDLPPPPPVAPEADYDPAADPAMQRKLAEEALAREVRVKESEERILNLPVKFTIGDKEFQVSGRPPSYCTLISRELACLGVKLNDLGKAVDKVLADGSGIEAIANLFQEQGGESDARIARIAQLLVQPLDHARPPEPADFILTADQAKWQMPMGTFGRMLMVWYVRDMMVMGGVLKKVLALGGTPR